MTEGAQPQSLQYVDEDGFDLSKDVTNITFTDGDKINIANITLFILSFAT